MSYLQQFILDLQLIFFHLLQKNIWCIVHQNELSHIAKYQLQKEIVDNRKEIMR